ncbi:O-antigen ligase family protein [Methylobacterium nigriterrae]|uniref:O-antigen ligase family protein n=1 Tax=Methylobacterium nigriterrae TaxID=3127512 RepID=UPI0030132DC7
MTSSVIAILFAAFVNQGVVYYVQQFLFGIDGSSPWPVVIATSATTLAAAVFSTLTEKFLRVALALVFLDAAYAATYAYSPSGNYGLMKAGLTMLVPALCATAGYLMSRDGRLRLYLASCAVLAGLAGAAFLLNNHNPELFAQSDRTGSGTYHPILITYQNFAFAMALGAVWAVDRFSSRLPRIDLLSGLSFVAFLYFILVSGGRLGLLIVLLTVITYTLMGERSRALRISLIAVIVVVGAVAAAVMSHFALEIVNDRDAPATLKRFVTYAFVLPEQHSLSPREIFRGLAVEVFWRAPFAGVGWGGFPISAGLPDVSGYYPHNVILELLSETGLLGTLAFLLFQGWVLWEFARAPGRFSEKNVIFIIFSIGLSWGMVGGDWPGMRVLFLAIGAMAGYPPGRLRPHASATAGDRP